MCGNNLDKFYAHVLYIYIHVIDALSRINNLLVARIIVPRRFANSLRVHISRGEILNPHLTIWPLAPESVFMLQGQRRVALSGPPVIKGRVVDGGVHIVARFDRERKRNKQLDM